MRLRKWRWPLIAVSVLVVGSITAAVMIGSHSSAGTLDPDSASADGGKALATLLSERGVSVSTVRSTADAVSAVQASGSDTTLLVTDPYLLTQPQLDQLAAQPTGRLVLLEPDQQAADSLATGIVELSGANGSGRTLLNPACSDPDAVAAGNADLGGAEAYRSGSSPSSSSSVSASVSGSCYAVDGAAGGFALMTTSGPASADTVLVGSRAPFRNDTLAANGNAALALRILGKHSKIVWYLPDTGDPGAASGQKTFSQVIPAGWRWAVLQLAIAALFLAVWQSRRLGPVAVENLPVAVRAAETVEGRARLYERGRVHGGAAAALREAARNRMAVRLGLPRTASAGDVATALTARGGRAAVATVGLLAGPPPANDDQLVRLAGALDDLEAEVGRL